MAPLERDPRYQSLEVWRGLACLMVVVDHAGIVLQTAEGAAEGLAAALVGGLRLSLGPPMFFVISGYCVVASLDSLLRKGRSSLDFLARRLWRTFPPYWAALALFAASAAALDRLGLDRLYRGGHGLRLRPASELGVAQWLGNLSLTEGWRPRFWGGEGQLLADVTWTLGYQEQFYVVSFLVALAASRRFHAALAATTAAIVLARLVTLDIGAAPRLAGLFLDYWHEFAVGLAVFWRLNARSSPASKRLADVGLLGLLALAASLGQRSTAAAAGFGLAMVALRRHDPALSRVAVLAPVRACGRRCYSIYLAHMPVVVVSATALIELGLGGFWARALVVVPAVAVAGVAAGWLFYRLVERRFAEPPSATAVARRARERAGPVLRALRAGPAAAPGA